MPGLNMVVSPFNVRKLQVRPDYGLKELQLFSHAWRSLLTMDISSTLCSVEQKQQARAYHPAQPTRAPDRRGRRVHRLHPAHTVRGFHRPPPFQPIRGDQSVASPRWQVA